MRHANAAVFVPHNGCPHRCSFCNQNTISGCAAQPGAEDVRAAARRAEETLPPGVPAEFAFFGGSFTAIGRAYMTELLDAVQPWLRKGVFTGIRCSTRPDCVDAELLSFLKERGVKAVELGAQSMDDAVLAKNGRGHTAADVERASRLIREAGLSLGLQMMTGLPGDTAAGAWETARRLAALSPDTMRIYPAIVLPGTAMAAWYREGSYRPMGLDEAVGLCAGLLDFFEQRGVRVIRVGLHSSPELERERLAGPYHPAFRELCLSRLFLRRMEEAASRFPAGAALAFLVCPRDLSAVLGQKRANLEALRRDGVNACVRPDESVPRGAFAVRAGEDRVLFSPGGRMDVQKEGPAVCD